MSVNSTPLPYTLQKRRLKIRPTRYGVVFILLLLGLFAGSINYANNLGYLLTFLLASIAFVSMAHTFKNIEGLKIRSCSTKPVFAGEPATFEFVTEDSGRDRYRIGFAFSEGKPANLDLARGPQKQINVQVLATSRGLLKPRPLTVHTDYPLGLFRVYIQLNPDLECIVFPKPQIGMVKALAEKHEAQSDGGYGGSGTDDFQGLVGYMPGDPLQRISWKASSRGRGLFIKDFSGHYGAAFYLDWQLVPGLDPEHKLSLLCHAVLKAQQQNMIYGLKLPGRTIAPGTGQIHRNRCLKTLAMF